MFYLTSHRMTDSIGRKRLALASKIALIAYAKCVDLDKVGPDRGGAMQPPYNGQLWNKKNPKKLAVLERCPW